MNELLELKEIIGAAHDGATHVDKDGRYLSYDKSESTWFVHTKPGAGYHVVYSNSICAPRSLADIKRQVKLLSQVKLIADTIGSNMNDAKNENVHINYLDAVLTDLKEVLSDG